MVAHNDNNWTPSGDTLRSFVYASCSRNRFASSSFDNQDGIRATSGGCRGPPRRARHRFAAYHAGNHCASGLASRVAAHRLVGATWGRLKCLLAMQATTWRKTISSQFCFRSDVEEIRIGRPSFLRNNLVHEHWGLRFGVCYTVRTASSPMGIPVLAPVAPANNG